MAEQRRRSGQTDDTSQIRQSRAEKLHQVEEVISAFEARLKTNGQKNKYLRLLESVSLGLYDEVDKLSKKAPAEQITDLVLQQVNDVIRETKQLVENDTYVQRLNEFVAAGDNPQQRDVIVVLRQVRQGLERFDNELKGIGTRLSGKRKEAQYLQTALQLYLTGNSSVEKDELERFHVHGFPAWLTNSDGIVGGYRKVFDFKRLDRMNIPKYFDQSND